MIYISLYETFVDYSIILDRKMNSLGVFYHHVPIICLMSRSERMSRFALLMRSRLISQIHGSGSDLVVFQHMRAQRKKSKQARQIEIFGDLILKILRRVEGFFQRRRLANVKQQVIKQFLKKVTFFTANFAHIF